MYALFFSTTTAAATTATTATTTTATTTTTTTTTTTRRRRRRKLNQSTELSHRFGVFESWRGSTTQTYRSHLPRSLCFLLLSVAQFTWRFAAALRPQEDCLFVPVALDLVSRRARDPNHHRDDADDDVDGDGSDDVYDRG